MIFYIAGIFEARERLRSHRDHLITLGHKVTSTWLDAPAEASMLNPEAPYVELADRDLKEIDASDTLLLDTLGDLHRGGREVEAGYALGKGKIVVVIGSRKNVFHYLCFRVESWESFFQLPTDMKLLESVDYRHRALGRRRGERR